MHFGLLLEIVVRFNSNFKWKYSQNFFDHAKKFATDAIKTPSKSVIQETAQATGDVVEYKITNKITKN